MSNIEFKYKRSDIGNIKKVFSNPLNSERWKMSEVSDLKLRIKKFHLMKQSKKCCYCRTTLKNIANLSIDIEHILPQSKFEQCMFHVDENLSVSCKNCNLYRKNDKTDFLKTLNKKVLLKYKSEHYKFIHPNFDVYANHMDYYCETVNDEEIIIFYAITEKGEYTYDYFKLSLYEEASMNSVQGIDDEDDDEESFEIREEIKKIS